MADFKYKIDWIPDSKKLRETVTPDVEPQGIASRPAPAQDKKEDMDFYTKMYEIMSAYFDTDEEAEQVLSSKKPDADKAKRSMMEEYGKLFMYATEPKEPAPVSEDPDRQFSGSGVSIEDRFPETNLSDTIADESTAPLSEVDPERRADEEFLRTGELPSEGLMSPKLDGKSGNLRESYDELEMDAYLDDFIPEMATLEGLDGDEVLGELEPTYSYGITEEKANEYNMQPSDYDTMEEFARAFAARYRKEKEDMYPDIFTEDLNKDVERGLQSYLWNRGSFYPGQLGELDNNNLNGFIDELKDVINAADTGASNNQSRPMSGLSKRRAAEANLVGRGIEGYVPVATVETTGTQQNPIFIWKDARGNEVNRFASNKPLHSMSTMGELAVTN